MLAKTRPEPVADHTYAEATVLAEQIQELLERAAQHAGDGEAYAVRLSQALARSLADQLAELRRHRAA